MFFNRIPLEPGAEGFPASKHGLRVFPALAGWQHPGVNASALVMLLREPPGREVNPRTGIIDSQSVKAPETGGIAGFDAGKKVRGRKRHIVVDTEGLLFTVLVHTASIRDCDGGADRLKAVRKRIPLLQLIWSDGGYWGVYFKSAFDNIAAWQLSIVSRSDDHTGFRPSALQVVVERTFAWIGGNMIPFK